MPNYCDNLLRLSGSKESLIKFLLTYCDVRLYADCTKILYAFNFNKVIPEPLTEEECLKTYGSKYILDDEAKKRISLDSDRPWFNWYEFHCNEWGTKWDACDPFSNLDNLDNGFIYISFQTAWSPCIPIINKLMDSLEDLCIEYTYYECGMGFAGSICKNIEGDYSSEHVDASDSEAYREFLIRNDLESPEYFEELDKEEEECEENE